MCLCTCMCGCGGCLYMHDEIGRGLVGHLPWVAMWGSAEVMQQLISDDYIRKQCRINNSASSALTSYYKCLANLLLSKARGLSSLCVQAPLGRMCARVRPKHRTLQYA